ncbi:nuclear transport factor 2 family protein [Ulvibacterium sp.]|uniref:nuclear transport factor 2 family protein n=1 Tax=Ulvibacterium sp. TaxID=2665914 RepID=UPI002604A8AD|nr:nuclear transport factor 2 family protein [Ulvibacterium sp.]
MKKVIVFMVLAIIAGSCRDREKPNETPKTVVEKITEEEALGLLHQWTGAYLAGDAAPLREILDESWVYSGSSDGTVSDKDATITEFANADYTFKDIVYEGLDVRLYGDVAVVRGSESMVIVGNSGGDTTKLRLRFTDVYQKKDGKIKAIATHSSPIAEE